MAPSQPHRIELPLFFNTPSRHADDNKPTRLNKTHSEYSSTTNNQAQN